MDPVTDTGRGTLFLIPVPLGLGEPDRSIPAGNLAVVREIRFFITEEIRSARRYLKRVDRNIDIDLLQFSVLNEHTRTDEVMSLLQPLLEGHDAGLLSEAGIPCVADPGSQLVRLAHQHHIRVVPLPGPSSIFLALMASGFQGQRFSFHGYLPVDMAAKVKAIREIESKLYRFDETQIFIETPYRNQSLLDALLRTCREETLLCLALDLTTETEEIISMPVAGWKKIAPVIHKRPAVFLMYR